MNFQTKDDFTANIQSFLENIEISNDVLPRRQSAGIRGIDYAVLAEAVFTRGGLWSTPQSTNLVAYFWRYLLYDIADAIDKSQSNFNVSAFDEQLYRVLLARDAVLTVASARTDDLTTIDMPRSILVTQPLKPIVATGTHGYNSITYDGVNVFDDDSPLIAAPVQSMFNEIGNLRRQLNVESYTGFQYYWFKQKKRNAEGGIDVTSDTTRNYGEDDVTITLPTGFHTVVAIYFNFRVYTNIAYGVDDPEDPSRVSTSFYTVARKQYTGAYSVSDGVLTISAAAYQSFIDGLLGSDFGKEHPEPEDPEEYEGAKRRAVCDISADRETCAVIVDDSHTDFWNS